MPGFSIQTGLLGQFDASQPPATIELARQHRWKFVTVEPLQSILIYAHKAGRPRPEIDRATLHQMQDCLYFPGKQKWLPIEITFYHVLGTATVGDVARQIYNWWSTQVIDIKTSKINLVKKTCQLDLVDGGGVTVYSYTMYGCWISKVTPEELDYSSTKIGEITFTLEMDKAIEELVSASESNTGNSSDPAKRGYISGGNKPSGPGTPIDTSKYPPFNPNPWQPPPA